MPKGQRLTEELRIKILKTWDSGFTKRTVCMKLGICRNLVDRVLKSSGRIDEYGIEIKVNHEKGILSRV